MNKLQSIVRFILNHLNNQLIKKLLKPALILGPVLFSLPAFSSTSIAIIDTGFCPVKSSNVIIHTVVDLTETVKLNCQKIDLKSPRFHGQHVLEEFLKFGDFKKKSLEVFPLIVFDAKGDQKKEYWLKAIRWVSEHKIDVILTAAGFITTADELKSLPEKLSGIWFVPSGRIGPGIKDSTILFPQALAPKDNLLLIGDYYDGKVVLFDQGLLYKDKIDFYFPSGKGDFVGTSRAVAEAAARALKLCSTSQKILHMRSCLEKSSKEYVDGISRKKVKTY